jgi:recombination endonuclease VII
MIENSTKEPVIMSTIILKRCTQCGEKKPATAEFFYRANKERSGLQSECKICKSARLQGYRHRLQAMDKIDPGTHQVCKKCKENKPIEEFGIRLDTKSGRKSWCKSCLRRSFEEERKRKLRSAYSLSREEYQQMLTDQQGVCASCHQPETSIHHRTGQVMELAVDHCHVTDAVRGLLCQRCNRALGLLYEEPEKIRDLLKYCEERCLY